MSEVKEYNIERPGHFIDWQPSCTNIACALRMPRNGRWRSFWPSSELLMMHEGKLFSFIPCIPQCVVKSRKKCPFLGSTYQRIWRMMQQQQHSNLRPKKNEGIACFMSRDSHLSNTSASHFLFTAVARRRTVLLKGNQ